MRIGTSRALMAALLLGLTGGPVAAQDQADALEDGRWLPFMGCWVEQTSSSGPMTCILPDGEGVEFLTVENSEVADRRVVQADGEERPVEMAGCSGVEAARFSSDGHRVFTRTRLECSGADRATRGLIAMVDYYEWIEIRALDAMEAGGSVAWVKRYGPAPATRIEAAGLTERVGSESRAVQAARMAAVGLASVDDVIEVFQQTDAEVAKSFIAEQGDPLRLGADELIRMADAGVPSGVIDVAIAVSFPDRFQLAREPRGDRGTAYGYDRRGAWNVWSPFGSYYYPYGSYYWRSSLYGYGSYWGYPGYWGPTRVIVRPVDDGDGASRGRVVKGRGYTGGGSTGPTARPRGSVRSTSSGASAVTGASSSSSGSRAKPKAKPRGGGGG